MREAPQAIAIRAYTEAARAKRTGQTRSRDEPSDWSLVFDCETTIDSSQRLRFGAYQVRRSERLVESGLFYDPGGLDGEELRALTAYAQARELTCRPLLEFVDKVFYRIGHLRGGAIIGFNLPFDLARIAQGHSEARKSMRGGFTFKLSRFATNPRVRAKHLSRRAALIDFATPPGQPTSRGSRKRKIKTPTHRGFFVDVSTLAAALMSEGFTLARLCERLKVMTSKIEGVEHGAPLTTTYLDCACVDVEATWECYVALRNQYRSHQLTTPLHRILSEASIGKAYLKDMGVAPLLQRMPDVSRAVLGRIMSAYYGGRAEVRWRRVIKRVLYCDFKSMYPTVNALMGLWSFVIGEGLHWRDGTDEARKLLDDASSEGYQRPAAWKQLAIIARVRPDHDLFPVRAKYDERINTIGLNFLTNKDDLWMTLADCIAAKILSGKAPVILEAIRFEPGPPQPDLKAIDLFGNALYRVDPAREDVFARLVDLRDEAKRKHDPLQQAIKIIANATSYGIFIEVLRDNAPKSETVTVYGPSGVGRLLQTKAIEQPGKFFHPLLGVLITGAARLMLALAEGQAMDADLDWAFCDTDSIALVKPEAVSEEQFLAEARAIIDWFEPLNPYQAPGSILKIEDCNYEAASKEIVPLYCWAISAKRYALFNFDCDGMPVIRKASAHGLGHFMAPYSEEGAPKTIPAPAIPLSEIGVDRWQYDLWYTIIAAALAGHPDQVRRDYHPALMLPAVTRFGVTSPGLERWMRAWNQGRAYSERVRPFGFMVTFQARDSDDPSDITSVEEIRLTRGRPKRRMDIKPIAPFDRDPAKAVAHAFDRVTGKAVSSDHLKTYVQALAQFHLHPEDKFLNGDFLNRGRTERRHVIASGVRLIGKEANKWEEWALAGEAGRVVGYGSMPRPLGR